ncbi:MAG: 30S ribosomal protein S15 [Candidatus Aminicenantia bacterium]
MVLEKEKRDELIKKFGIHSKDTGSADVQIVLLTKRINYLTEHLKVHKKDYHSKMGLVKLVGRRKRLMEYLKREDQKRYLLLVKELGLKG